MNKKNKTKKGLDIETKRCAGRHGEMCQNRGRLRCFLSCGLIYGCRENKSFTSIHTAPALNISVKTNQGIKNTLLFRLYRMSKTQRWCFLLNHIPMTVHVPTSVLLCNLVSSQLYCKHKRSLTRIELSAPITAIGSTKFKTPL